MDLLYAARRRVPCPAAAILAVVLSLSGLPATSVVPDRAWAENGATFTGIVVLPDDGAAPFLDEVEAANESILLYIYLLSDEEMIAALMRAHYRGVDVQVMLDPVPYGGARSEGDVFDRLTASGIEARWSSGAFRFAHVKMLVIDRTTLLVMNLNFTEAAFDSNRDFAVVTDDPARVDQAVAIFDNDWHGRMETPDGPLVVSPETSRTDLLGFISNADKSIEIYAEIITDSAVLDALVNADRQGIRVRLVMSQSADESLWHEEPGFLAREGVEVRIVNRVYIHAKAVIVDGEAAWLGSQNFTANSLDNNREIGTFVEDPASLARLIGTFESDYAEGQPLAQPSR